MKPAAVIRAAKAADQMVRDMAAGKPVAAPAPAAPAPNAPPEPQFASVGEVPAGFAPAPAATAQPAAPASEQPAAAAAPAPSAQPAAAPVDWEQKYRVLEGKYRAEVPRLLDSLTEARSVAEQTARQNQELAAQLRQPAPTAQPVRREDTFQPLVSDKEREAFGEDLIDVIGRRAQEAVLPAVQQLLRQELQPLKQQVGATAAQAAQQGRAGVYAMLNDQVPGWDGINNSVEFLAWLEGVDVFSGASRRAALAAAFNNNDAPRVVGIFKAFLRENASPGSTSAPQPQVAAETLIAPGVPRGGSAQEVAPNGSRGKIWSEGEIRNFYDRVRRKQVPQEEYDSTSVELAAAVREGRVRPDRVDIHMNQR